MHEGTMYVPRCQPLRQSRSQQHLAHGHQVQRIVLRLHPCLRDLESDEDIPCGSTCKYLT